jgi:hypothetical protein
MLLAARKRCETYLPHGLPGRKRTYSQGRLLIEALPHPGHPGLSTCRAFLANLC